MVSESVLRTLRQSRGLTLETVANAVNLSVNGYYQIERGQRSAPKEAAERIAGFFGETIDRLFMPISFSVREMEVI